jgi:hypothetical protein
MMMGRDWSPSEINGTVHFQPIWPFLSKYQVPPPRFTISACQWMLLAGIAIANVTAAAIITPQRIPIRKTRLVWFLSILLQSKLAFRPVLLFEIKCKSSGEFTN